MSVQEAAGAVLARSVSLLDGPVIAKGTLLGPDVVARLHVCCVTRVVVVHLESGEVAQDEAARRVAAALAGPHINAGDPTGGRCDLVAERDGTLLIDAQAVASLNAVGEGIQVTTLPPGEVVNIGQAPATVSVGSLAVPGDVVERCVECARGPDPVVAVAPVEDAR